MKLKDHGSVAKLEFKLDKRELIVFHDEDELEILASLDSLSLDTVHVHTEEVYEVIMDDIQDQSKVLWQLLFINAAFFLIEMVYGVWSGSMGLVADSLDMLSDALVYSLSLYAVGSAVTRKKNVAKISGYIQLLLAFTGITEVIRRYFLEDAVPDYLTMIIVSFLALLGNALCLYLLQRSRLKEVHMKASMIFTANDIFINAGVIFAGLLVLAFSSRIPDLIIGSIVFGIVLRGAFRILKLAK